MSLLYHQVCQFVFLHFTRHFVSTSSGWSSSLSCGSILQPIAYKRDMDSQGGLSQKGHYWCASSTEIIIYIIPNSSYFLPTEYNIILPFGWGVSIQHIIAFCPLLRLCVTELGLNGGGGVEGRGERPRRCPWVTAGGQPTPSAPYPPPEA